MKTAVIFLAVAVYGGSALSIPTLAWVNSTAQKVIEKTHDINGQTIQLADSTNQAVADFVKDGSQTGTLWFQDGVDKVGDKTKDGISLVQGTTNQLLNIVGQFGGPLKWGAAVGSKVTDLTAEAGKTMTDIGVGSAQLGSAVMNQAFGVTVGKAADISAGVAGKATAANDITAHLSSVGVNKAVEAVSSIGKGVGSIIENTGKGIYDWFKLPSLTKNADVEVIADVDVNADVNV